MGFSNINHYHGPMVLWFLNEWDSSSDLEPPVTELYGIGVAKTPWGNGWVVGGCHILPHVVWWIWMNLSWFFLLKSCKTPLSSPWHFPSNQLPLQKTGYDSVYFHFTPKNFQTALVFGLPLTVSSSHLATRELPLVEFDLPQGKRADGWMKTADGKYQKFGVHKAMKNDGKCRVFLGWEAVRTMELLKLPSLKLT